MTLYERIELVAVHLGLLMSQLAKKIGTTSQTFSNYSGDAKKGMSDKVALRFSIFLNVPMGWIKKEKGEIHLKTVFFNTKIKEYDPQEIVHNEYFKSINRLNFSSIGNPEIVFDKMEKATGYNREAVKTYSGLVFSTSSEFDLPPPDFVQGLTKEYPKEFAHSIFTDYDLVYSYLQSLSKKNKISENVIKSKLFSESDSELCLIENIERYCKEYNISESELKEKVGLPIRGTIGYVQRFCYKYTVSAEYLLRTFGPLDSRELFREKSLDDQALDILSQQR